MTKTYLGVKMVTARPKEKDGQTGYEIEYPDGYISWSPMDVFEAAYFPLAEGEKNKICQADVDAFVGFLADGQLDEKTTIVMAETLTGFRQHEVSSCVDPANYNHALGVSIATNRIKDRIWPMLGFVLQWAVFGLKRERTEPYEAFVPDFPSEEGVWVVNMSAPSVRSYLDTLVDQLRRLPRSAQQAVIDQLAGDMQQPQASSQGEAVAE